MLETLLFCTKCLTIFIPNISKFHINYKMLGFLSEVKGIVNVNSSDPLCKDDNIRLTTVPFKALSKSNIFKGTVKEK